VMPTLRHDKARDDSIDGDSSRGQGSSVISHL